MDFSKRSREAEIIDAPERLSPAEMKDALRELRLVNRWLGGTRAVLKPLKKVVVGLSRLRPQRPVRVLDFGSGAADIPLALVGWARRRSIPVRVLALDFNHEACRLARSAAAGHPEIEVVRADVHHPCLRTASCDIALFSAFLHHFTDREIAMILRECRSLAEVAILVNDLQRSRWAYLGIRALTALFSRSAAVKNDGPLSVRRGFRKKDLRQILTRAGLSQARIYWRWAFRLVVEVDLAREPVLLAARDLKQNRIST